MLLRRFFRRLFLRSTSGARSNLPKLVVVLLVLLALPAIAYWRGMGLEQSDVGQNSTEMVVERIDQSSSMVNLVLKEKAGPRRLVVALGLAEALSIAGDLKLNTGMPDVNAYGLSRSLVDSLGGRVQRVVVNNVTDKNLYAKVILSADNREVVIDAAPSDAIALAVRAKAPIFVDAGVLDKAGIVSGR